MTFAVNPFKDGIFIHPWAVRIAAGFGALAVVFVLAEELPQAMRYIEAERMGLMPQQKRNKRAIRP